MGFGGPVWHASARATPIEVAVAMAERAVRGVGDAELGEWRQEGHDSTYHLRRRVAEWEAARWHLTLRDVRDTPEHAARIVRLLRDAPHLAGIEQLEAR